MKIIKAAVSRTSYSFDDLFTYLLPTEYEDIAKAGMRVTVPFGRGNSKRIAMIMEVSDGVPDNNIGFKLKSIDEIIDKEPALNDEMIKLVKWLNEYTFCTYFDAVRAMLPSGMNFILKKTYRLAENIDASMLSEAEINFISKLSDCKSQSAFDKIISDTVSLPETKPLVLTLEKKGMLKPFDVFKRNVGDAFVRMVVISDKFLSSPADFTLSPKQRKVISVLEEGHCASVKELCYICGVTEIVVKNLIKSGVLEQYECETYRSVVSESNCKTDISRLLLSEKQQQVFDEVSNTLSAGKAECFLLQGVTGSGKTSVFQKLINEVISSGRQALMLVPEIALTPQVIESFCSLFGSDIAVMHSGLSISQRLDEYKRIKRGLVKIVIGTRSAVFAPLENIGIIIMDEEGERCYKSEASPRYSTVSVAIQRCRYHNAVLLLASATPSFESRYLAEKGVYKLLRLDERYKGAVLPEVFITDMGQERLNGNNSEFSIPLINAVNENLERKEQTVILLNRRGYHTVITCGECGKAVECPNCSVPMTFHKANGCLVCHCCGHIQQANLQCPYCHSKSLYSMGFGTQKLQEQLEFLFPSARILRMDADTTSSRYAYEKNFSDFREGKYDIMVGTQMIGKGLDFPNVTLVGVLSVDKVLFSGDFRAYERTFSLITQVIGRGGRGDKKGRAYLQTAIPDHYVIKLAACQNYDAFYNEEMKLRKSLLFPPVCDICIIGLSSEKEEKCRQAADMLFEMLKSKAVNENVSFPLRIMPPSQPIYKKVNGKFRYRIILKSKNIVGFRKFVRDILKECGKDKVFSEVTVFADLNGETDI